jgi:hypothetical protein
MKFPVSTTALSAYNVIAKSGIAVPVNVVFNIVRSGLEDETLTRDEFARVLVELEGRGLVRIVDAKLGTIDLVDPQRRVVRERDRTKGTDGWNGWKVDSPKGRILLQGEIR